LVFGGRPILGYLIRTPKESDMILILNLVLCLLVIAMVVTPLARAISGSRSEPAGAWRRRSSARSASRASRSFAPGV
jgi:hypothetical protein